MLTNKYFKPFALLLTVSLIAVGCQKQSESTDDTKTDNSNSVTHQNDGHEHEHDHDHDHDHEHEHEHDHEHGMEGHDHGHIHGEHNHVMSMTPYECEPKKTIQAHYADDTQESDHKDKTHLLIDGIEYDLTPMVVTAGAAGAKVYETDIGINDNSGMIWQVDGDKGVLVNKTLDGSVPVDKEKVLFTCFELKD